MRRLFAFHRLFALQCLLLAIALRAFVPVGWMPAPSGTGVTITICTGAGLVEAEIGPDGKIHHDGGKDTKVHDPCPFGTISHAVDIPQAAVFVPPPVLPRDFGTFLALRTLPEQLGGLPPPARGPPLTV